ncbi:MAG: DnaA/Hda family protein [Candidatus Thermoplasmatota archaeon]
MTIWGKKKDKQEKPNLLVEMNVVLEYTFDRFVVGDSNKFAYEVAVRVAKEPGSAYNPLLIYGPIGIGKTHLVNAIANYVLKDKPETKVYYTTPDEFSLKLGIPRDTDILIMEDVQFISSKSEVQEKFFYVFNALYQSKKQIILTSDRPPKDIKYLQERLRSRFESGLMASIKPPDLGLRTTIVRRVAKERGEELPDEVVHTISLSIDSNIRDLKASVEKVIEYSRAHDKKPTSLILKEALGEHFHFAGQIPSTKTISDFDETLNGEKLKQLEYLKKIGEEEGLRIIKGALPYRRELRRGLERRIEKCIDIVKGMKMDKAASLEIEKLLPLARLHLKRENYE